MRARISPRASLLPPSLFPQTKWADEKTSLLAELKVVKHKLARLEADLPRLLAQGAAVEAARAEAADGKDKLSALERSAVQLRGERAEYRVEQRLQLELQQMRRQKAAMAGVISRLHELLAPAPLAAPAAAIQQGPAN